MLATAFFYLSALAKTVTCVWPFDTSFAYWAWQSAVVVDQWLYIEGGEYHTLEGNGAATNLIKLAATLSVDLSQPWTVDSVSVRNNSNRPSVMSLVRRPQLWYDPLTNLVMGRGGFAYDGSAADNLWTFPPDGQGGVVWSLNRTASRNAAQLTPSFGGAFTATATSCYSLGGAVMTFINDSVFGFALEGLTIYDFTTDTWKSFASFGWSQSGYAVQSQAAFMPNFGQEGLVVFVGGDAPPNQTYQYQTGAALVEFSDVTVYDPASDTWYHQAASGSVPPPRSEFCAVGSASKDNGSYELYVFGGSTNLTFDGFHRDDAGYLDVSILSMPSFVWFKAGTTTQVRRANHFCQIIGAGQMLVIGGRDPSRMHPEGFLDGVDPWTRGMNIFDMNSLNWTGAYIPGIIYDRPPVIQQYYTNHANETKWSNTSLAALFSLKPSTTSAIKGPFITSAIKGTSSDSSPSRTPTPQPNHAGAIAGGAVGGLAGIFLVLASAFYLVRRRQSSASEPGMSSHGILQTQRYEMPSHGMLLTQRSEMESLPVEMESLPVEMESLPVEMESLPAEMESLLVELSGADKLHQNPPEYPGLPKT